MNRRSFLKLFGSGLASLISPQGFPRTKNERPFFSIPRDVSETGCYWYVDSIDGSDANDGLSSLTPLKTITKLVTKPIYPGQKVGFRRGSVFRETLTIPSSGSAGNSITYLSYGSGAAPRILGSNALSGWTQTSIPEVSADILSESFETIKPVQNGYDNAAWIERAGTGCFVDADNTDVPRPDGNAQVLKIQKGAPTFEAEAEISLGAEHTVCYTSLFIYIAAEGLTDGDSLCCVRERTASTLDVMDVILNKSGTQLRFAITVFNHGATDTTFYNVRTGQWYLVSLKYDYTHKTYEKCVNGSLIDSGMLGGTVRTGVQSIILGDSSQTKTLTAYFYALKVSSTNYPITAVALPANCYKASLNERPRELYFEQTTGKVRRGLVQTDLASCNSEFKWYYHINGYVVLYAPSDPGSLYHAVEAGIRKNCIAHNNQTYIIIDGLEVAYSVQDTISTASHWTVQYCNSHHASRANIMVGGAYGGVYGDNVSNCTVRFCTIHDHPCKGVQFDASNGGAITGNLVEHNVFYDNSDFSVDCQVFSSGNAHTGLVVQYNEFYTTADWEINSTGANGIFTKGRLGYPMVGPVVRYNLFHDLGGTGVQAGPNVSGMEIYNNTFARTLSGYDGSSNGIYIDSTADACIIKNNIGYGFDYQMYIPNSSGVREADYNCWYAPGTGRFIYTDGTIYRAGDFTKYHSATGWDAHGLWTNPMFASTLDFHLQAGSPCIDAGEYLGITQDFAGITVGNPPEMGAYELVQHALVSLSNLSHIYDGSSKEASASTTPPGLNVSLMYTGISGTVYGPSTQGPIEAGSYQVDATILDPNYSGSATEILLISKARATIVFDGLNQVFDGTPREVRARTIPPGLDVSLTYTGIEGTTFGPSTTAPIQAGEYQVEACIADLNYQGSASSILTIVRNVFIPIVTH